jgi:hypothetical protein
MAKQNEFQSTGGGGARVEPGILDELLERGATPANEDNPASGSMLIGHLSGIDDSGRMLFRPEGETESIRVAIGVAASDGALVRAARLQQRAVVQRISERPERYLLTGLVRERIASETRDADPGKLEVSLDGETVALSATHRIELRCGKASLTLTKDGRVVLKGAHVVSRSTGPNKVKGASIALN